jgi:predicted RNase H-like HicB family nuclease
MRRYTAIYTYDPDDRVWLVHLAEEERVHTDGRTLGAAKRMIRDAATLWFESNDQDIVDKVEAPADAIEAVTRYQSLRDELERTERETREALADATGRLRVAGLSMREAGEVLGLSYQRVGQVAKTARPKAAAAKAASNGTKTAKAAKSLHTAKKATPKRARI